MDQKKIGLKIAQVRAERGMAQIPLAAKVGVSQAQICRLEKGLQGFRSDTLSKIAEALDVDALRLVMTDAEWERWTKLGGKTGPAPRRMERRSIGAVMRSLRKAGQHTAPGFARLAEISEAHVSRLENGKQTFRSSTLGRIAKALGVPSYRMLMTDEEWNRWESAH